MHIRCWEAATKNCYFASDYKIQNPLRNVAFSCNFSGIRQHNKFGLNSDRLQLKLSPSSSQYLQTHQSELNRWKRMAWNVPQGRWNSWIHPNRHWHFAQNMRPLHKWPFRFGNSIFAFHLTNGMGWSEFKLEHFIDWKEDSARINAQPFNCHFFFCAQCGICTITYGEKKLSIFPSGLKLLPD